MNSRRCQRIAERLQTEFRIELGIELDLARMLVRSDYIEDVLIVCEAQTGTDLPALAQLFRVAAARTTADTSPGALDDSQSGARSTGFDSSTRQPQSHSTFEQERQAVRAARRSPSWMQPGRWLGHDS